MNKIFYKKFFLIGISVFGFIFFIFTKTDVFFSPKDDIEAKLINRINTAKNRIYVAVYMFTDKKIAHALIAAKKRGVDVQVVTDRSCFDSEFGKIKLLKENGVTIFVFKSNENKNKYQNKLMHNKFALIDKKICTGSFNWTISANVRNQENIIFMEDGAILQKYEKKFEELKKICIHNESFSSKSRGKSDGIAYKAYQKLIDRTTEFLKSIRDVLAAS